MTKRQSLLRKKRPVRRRSTRGGRWGRFFTKARAFLGLRLVQAGLAGGVMVLFIGTVAYKRYDQRLCVWAENYSIETASNLGFRLKHVQIKGQQYVSNSDLKKSLAIRRGGSIFQNQLSSIKRRLEQLSWVKSAVVYRRLPRTLIVNLQERRPIALWQRQKKLYVIDSDGVSLAEKEGRQFSGLPVVIGIGAPARAHQMLQLLQSYPAVQKQLLALTWVGGRRWTLDLKKGGVHLPEKKVSVALDRLQALVVNKKINWKTIRSVDFRLENKLIIQKKKD